MSDFTTDKFISDVDQIPPCWTCIYKHSGRSTCDAFPKGIPVEIATGQNQHREPVPGDRGIQYERRPNSGEGDATS